ncbi:MAG: DUF956 family protein [Erysipelotrichaceae bacterium]|nr:DUF956 family protein [Erysipelotrichaceae bacterium]
MIQSINTKAILTVDATSYLSIPQYGKLLIGDQGFEFYCDRNVRHNIQIPWNQITHIAVFIVCKKWIVRFCIYTHQNGEFWFASKQVKRVLNLCADFIGKENLVSFKKTYKHL